jgi:hypothetical protein
LTKNEGDIERLKLALDAWKYVVSVQMHFTDIEMRVRNLYFTILAASFGLIGVAQGKNISIPLPAFTISLTLLVVAAVIPVSMLFYFMDRHWYHRLLQGAVKHGAEIERLYGDALPEIRMGTEISKESPVKFSSFIWKLAFLFVRDRRFRDKSMLHSDQKIEVLYKSVIWACIVIFVVYASVNGIKYRDRTAFEWAFA